MILDSINNVHKYAKLSDSFRLAMEFLLEHKDGGLPSGNYQISDDVYAMSKYYTTEPIENCEYESHKDYIDIQYIVQGREQIGWANASEMIYGDYDKEDDCYTMHGEGQLIELLPKHFMILYPEDIHMPAVALNGSDVVEKILVKVKVSSECKNR